MYKKIVYNVGFEAFAFSEETIEFPAIVSIVAILVDSKKELCSIDLENKKIENIVKLHEELMSISICIRKAKLDVCSIKMIISQVKGSK